MAGRLPPEHPTSLVRNSLKEPEYEYYLRLNEVTSWTEIVSIHWQAAMKELSHTIEISSTSNVEVGHRVSRAEYQEQRLRLAYKPGFHST